MSSETEKDVPFSPKKRIYREISRKYCAHLDDQVIVIRQDDRMECLSAHRCGPPVDQTAQGSVANCPRNL